MHFEGPAYLWLLVLLPFVGLCLNRYLSAGRSIRKIWGSSSASSLLAPQSREWFSTVLVILAFVCLVFALAGPYLREVMEHPQYRKMNMVLLLDVSPSMNAQDVWPSRMARAKEVIRQFVQRDTQVVRFGLVSFSESSVILSYLTSDPQNLLFYLDFLRPDRRIIFGTDIGSALGSGLQVLEKHEQRREFDPTLSPERSVMVLLSDGEDHGESLDTGLHSARDRAIRIHTIGLGTSQGAVIPVMDESGRAGHLENGQGVPLVSKLTVETLQDIAKQTGGRFFQASSGAELEAALKSILDAEREVIGYEVGASTRELFHYFVLFAFFSFVLVMTLRF